MIDEQLVRSRAVIGLVPKAAIEVRRVPEFKEATSPGAYYSSPALDGTRPGVFYANLRDMNEVPKFSMRTLAVHEGVPGHHFQISLAQEQQGRPTFRTVVPFTAYGEGWALYAEWLGTRDGRLRGRPLRRLGSAAATRCCARCGWSSIPASITSAGPASRRSPTCWRRPACPKSAVVSEVERYIVDPGQACAYKVGMLRIQAARERAQKALGPRFDAAGAEGLPRRRAGQWRTCRSKCCEEQVDAWIKSRV